MTSSFHLTEFRRKKEGEKEKEDKEEEKEKNEDYGVVSNKRFTSSPSLCSLLMVPQQALSPGRHLPSPSLFFVRNLDSDVLC